MARLDAYSCSFKKQINHVGNLSSLEQQRLFLKHVMIREAGLYVLLGSKPMTEFDVTWSVPKTLEEKQTSYADGVLGLKKWNKEQEAKGLQTETILSFEDYSKQCDEQKPFHDHLQLWQSWQTHKDIKVGTKYRFIQRKCPDTETVTALFINIPNSIFILKKHYKAFVDETTLEYDPNTILDQISDNTSRFWNRVFNNNFLFGLLMGYGERSSFLFHWYWQKDLENPSIGGSINKLSDWSKAVTKEKVSMSDLPLPPFVLFSIHDETKERYRHEREQIIKLFQKRDFVSLVKQYLCD